MTARLRRLIVGFTGCAVVASSLVAMTPPAIAEVWKAPEAQQFDFVDVTSPAAATAVPDRVDRTRLARPAWPTAGEVVVADVAGAGKARRAGGLPVSVAAPAKAAKPVDTARVRVLDQSESRKLVGTGVVVTVAAQEGAQAAISLDYASFTAGAGGGYGSRLRWVRLPACALDRPDDPDCRTTTPVPSVNDTRAQSLQATITLPNAADPQADERTPTGPAAATDSMMVLAAVAGVSSDQGNYGATSLKSSSMWQAGGSAGTFSWSYPLRTPPVAGSLAPELAISYNSGSTDGAVSNANNQASWIGEGFGLSMGFIERTYTGCVSDLPDRGSAPQTAGELCWWSDTKKTNNAPWDNATLNLGAHSGTLVRIANSSQWRLKDDDGTRIEKVGTPATGGSATSEYWKVTTTDGTQYFFGKGKADGAAAAATLSRWIVPVGANHTGEPGYNAAFAQAIHDQVWRWNLDYVMDPSGDTMTVYYNKEANQYKKLGSTLTSYDRGGTINAIHYGERKGAEAGTPAAKVEFSVTERCDTVVSAGCATTAPTPSTVNAWPDVPTDAICEAGGYCPDPKTSPTFFSRKRLTKVATWSRNTADTGYDSVDAWTIAAVFPATNDATSTPTLWPASITHSGEAGGTITLPKVTLTPATMRNRIKGAGSNIYGLNRPRLSRILDESGGRVSVYYSAEDCTPTALPADAATNTTRCFPVAYANTPTDTPTLHWFTKYVVNQVEVHDTSTATIGLPAVSGLDLSAEQVTTYTYTGGGAWRWDDSPFTPDNQRTWNQWRGYGKTLAVAGKTGAPQTVTEETWFRGMHGNRTASGGTATVNVTDSAGTAKPDLDVLAGQLRETRTLRSATGTPDPESRTINDLWTSLPTADDGRDQALMIDIGDTRTTQFLAAGQRNATTTVKARDGWGQPVLVEETGDEAVTGDERCTRTRYADPSGSAQMVDLIADESVTPAPCPAAPDGGPSPADVIGWERHYYDGAGLGVVTGPGFETRTDFLTGASTRTWRTASTATYDVHGRALSATDVLGRTSTTSYNPATSRAPRTVTNTTPDPDSAGPAQPLVTTSTFDHRWGLETRTVEPAGQVTEATLDPLGRVTAVWLPGRDKATQTASEKYTYQVTGNGINAVRTESLLPDGTNYLTNWSILDGLLRPRQTQTTSVSVGSQVQDLRYDSRGNPVLVDDYLITGAPSSTMVAPTARGNIKRSARASYDFANRPVKEALYSGEVFKWQTTTTYDGDRVKVTPPAGGTPTTTISDIQGRTVSLTEHLGIDTTAPGSTTTYSYNPAGQLAAMADPKGNTWSYTYDLAGNQLTASDPDAGTTTMAYDEANRLTSTADARGQGTAVVYDALDRVVKTTSLDGATTLTSTVYDTLKPGLVTSSSRHVDGAELTNRVDSYDNIGRPTATSLVVPAITGLIPAGLAGTYQVTTSYKPDGSVATTGLPATGPVAAETLTYAYGPKGAPTSLAGMAKIVNGTAYTQWNTVSSINMGAVTGQQIVAMRDRDEATLRLTRIRTVRQVGGSSPDEDTSYTYDPAGNIIQAKATLKTGVVDNQCFQYDYQGQLKAAFTAAPTITCSATTTPTQSTLGAGPSPYWTSWTTDTIGKTSQRVDRTATTASTTTYSYPANGAAAVRPHAVSQTVTTGSTSATRTYGYDAAGNTTSRPGPSGAAQSLSYDAEGNLTEVSQGGSVVARMVYDASGERVIRQEAGKTTLTVAGTELTVDNTTGVATAARYYSHAGQTVAVRTGNTNAELFSLINDHQGTAHNQIRNSDSQLQTSWQDPYGNKRGTAPATWAGGRGFVGGLNDVSTGLVRLGARDFDPVLQRFTTVDPVQVLDVPLQWNPYLYGDNSPVTKADPSGLCWICGIGNAIASAARAVVGVVKATVTKVASTVKKVATAVVKKVTSVAAKVVHEAVKIAKKVVKAVTTAVHTVKAAVKHTVKKVVSKVKHVASAAGKAVSHAAKAVSEGVKRAGDTLNEYGDAIQLGLDVVGLVPVVGEIADGANAIIYAAKGDYANAALSAAAMIPVGGQAATGLKLGLKGLNVATDIAKRASKAGWSVGDDIYSLTKAGNKPAWSTVRARFWKNEAAHPQIDSWSPANVDRMSRGRAPQRFNQDKGGLESMELSHEPIPFRDGGTNVIPRWPQDHAAIDPFRFPGY